MEFRFGDEIFTAGDAVRLQTVEGKKYWGIIQTIETQMIEDSACTLIKIKTLYGEKCVNADEIEFLKGEY